MNPPSNLYVKQNCLFCASPLGTVKYQSIIDRLSYVPGYWDLIECSDCRSLVVSPFPSSADVMKYYPDAYNIPPSNKTSGVRKIISIVERKFMAFLYHHEVAQLYKNTEIFKGKRVRVLEIGCGTGNRLDFFQNRNVDIVGVDISKDDVESIKSRGINAICADINNLSEYFPSASFDVIMGFDILEHIPDLEKIFSKLTTLLKPGGWIVAGLPSSDCFAGRIFGKDWLQFKELPRHVSIPSILGATRLFERNNLTSIRHFPYHALGCSFVFGLSVAPGSAAAAHFYKSQLKISTNKSHKYPFLN